MSNIKRYTVHVKQLTKGVHVSMKPYDDGEYVLYSDYAALAAENERLREELDELYQKLDDDFNDAEEGRDAK